VKENTRLPKGNGRLKVGTEPKTGFNSWSQGADALREPKAFRSGEPKITNLVTVGLVYFENITCLEKIYPPDRAHSTVGVIVNYLLTNLINL
jgi:hypothetical protein